MSGLSWITVGLGFMLVFASAVEAPAQLLSICDIQYTVNTNGSSTYDGCLVNCTGGIVVGKYEGTRPRIFLQDPNCPAEQADPNCPEGWGGIQVKDWTWPYQLFGNVQLGDLVELTNVRVEEYVGVTFLQYTEGNGSSFTSTSGYALPGPVIVSVGDIPAPIECPGDEWRVENHDAECYESMRLVVRDVTIEEMDLGKALDNYALQNSQQQSCWAADYMNQDKELWEDYHPFVDAGRRFCALGGLFEQYTSGRFDYYQLVTLETENLALCGDGNSDGEIDLDDMVRFAECLTGPLCNSAPGGCDPPAWTWAPDPLPLGHCLMMDLNFDGDVDSTEYAGLQAILGAP